MSIRTETFEDAKRAVDFIEELAYSDKYYIFRGHSDSSFHLETTWSRFNKSDYGFWSDDLEKMLRQFKDGLRRIGIYPFESDSNQDLLEYSRHYGLPSPLLDFSNSPYIALFFAFNGLIKNIGNTDYTVVNILDIELLAHSWALYLSKSYPEAQKREKEYERELIHFQDPDNFGIDGLCLKSSGKILRFFAYPGEYNTRMQRQLGVSIFDFVNYKEIKLSDGSTCEDLEDYIEKTEENDEDNCILTRVLINKKCKSKILEMLDLMGIKGSYLFLSADGVVMDAVNSYFYEPKTMEIRD